MTGTAFAPIDWLNELREQPDGYRRLLEEAGCLSSAAWHLARARCRAWHVATEVPSGPEVRAAARELCSRLHLDACVPSSSNLASECEAMGLLVV